MESTERDKEIASHASEILGEQINPAAIKNKLSPFELAVKCIDASLRSADEMANGSDILSEFEYRLSVFREEFGDPQEDHEFTAEYDAAYKALEYDLMLYVWDHIQELMLNCGAGDVAEEVFNKENE